jgi:hypothetical protein
MPLLDIAFPRSPPNRTNHHRAVETCPCVGSDWLGRAVRRATSKLAGRLAKSLSVADGETFGTTSPDRPAADRWYRNNIRKAELKAGFNCAEL